MDIPRSVNIEGRPGDADIEAARYRFRAEAVARVRRTVPVETPEWVNRIPDRIADILVEKHLYRNGPVWGLSKRNPYQDLPYDEVGSRHFALLVARYNLWDRAPELTEQGRAAALRFWQEWQDPDSGRFFDPRDRARVVNEKFVIANIKTFGGAPLYPAKSTQMLAIDEQGKINTEIFLERTRDDPDWSQGGWGVGSHTGRMAKQLFYAINDGHPELAPVLELGLEQVLSHQDPCSGLWGPASAALADRIGGTLKVVSRLYFGMGMQVPHTAELADSLIAHQENGSWFSCGNQICVPVNVCVMVAYCLEVSGYRRDGLLATLESVADDYKSWITPDGGIMMQRGDPSKTGVEVVHISALGIIGGYLHWQNCRLTNSIQESSHMQRGIGFRYKPVLQEDGTVKVIDSG